MNSPLISIIIPVYNTEPSMLDKCLNSIISQTYSNYEIIIVDDGSKTEIASYLDSLKNIYSNINIIHQENQGASVARNTGIKAIKGKYFCFSDADDFLQNNLLEKLVNAAESNESDLCIAEFVLLSDVTGEELCGMKNKYECTIEVNDMNRIALMQQTFHYIPSKLTLVDTPHECSSNELWLQGKVWGKLYKTDMYKNEFFVRGIPLSQDAVYTIDILKKCKKVSFVKDACYFYYINQSSLSRKKETMKGLDIQFVSMKQKLVDFPDIFEGMYSFLIFGAIKNVINGNGFFKGYKIIKNFCLLPEIMDINNSLSMNSIAHSQEKRTRICLRNKWFFAYSLFIQLSILKDKVVSNTY